MRKLLVSCECGQQIQVPRSAIGRMGMCPTCGLTIRISAANTSPVPKRRRPAVYSSQDFSSASGGPQTPEDAKQRFGQAVDHYYGGRYGEALAIFDSLAKQFPGNPDIERGRAQCIQATKRPSLPAQGSRSLLTQSDLDEETVRRVILEKLLNGGSEAIQLQAAELAAKILGMLDPARPAEEAGQVPESEAQEEETPEDEGAVPREDGEDEDIPLEVPVEAMAEAETPSKKEPDPSAVESPEAEAFPDDDAIPPTEEKIQAMQ